jgi:hypothetical protein
MNSLRHCAPYMPSQGSRVTLCVYRVCRLVKSLSKPDAREASDRIHVGHARREIRPTGAFTGPHIA